MKHLKQLSEGLIFTGVVVLLMLILLLAWMGIRRWRTRRLSPEEKLLIDCAYKSQGMIQLIQADQIPQGWVRAGGRDFNTDPERAAIYRAALERLVARGHVEKRAENLFVLTHSGWKHIKKRPVL